MRGKQHGRGTWADPETRNNAETKEKEIEGKEWHVLKREGEAQGLSENSVEGAREQQKMSLQEALNAKLKY